MTNFRQHITGLSFRIISGTIILLLVVGILESLAGYLQFTKSLTNEYNESAFRTAETAATLVNGDKLQEYLDCSGECDDYKLMQERLYTLCQKQNVTLIYVLCPDTDTYDEFTLVISVQNKSSSYDPWPIGYRRETTNDEYRTIYKDIYENGLERGTILRTDSLRGKEPHITSLIPVKAGNGEVSGILCVQRPMAELKTGRHRFLIYILSATVLLTLLVSITTYLFLRKHFVVPMRTVTKEAQRFAKENSAADENLLKDISSISEIEVLAESLDRMERDNLLFVDRLTRMTAENKRISTELSIARQIQAAVLPNEFPPFPGRHEFDIYASMAPAKEVGGDFYDFFLIDEDHLGLVIADVSGKGVPAALFMMIAKLLIKLRAYSGGDPGDMLSDVSGTLCERNPMEFFVTAWFVIFTVSTGEGVAVNAGHENPILRHADGDYEYVRYKHQIPLAAVEGLKYKSHEFRLLPGDSIFIYTDGVTEAENNKKEMFGEDRLLAGLNRDPDADPEKSLKNVKDEIDSFVDGAEPFDDITMLGFRYNGPQK